MGKTPPDTCPESVSKPEKQLLQSSFGALIDPGHLANGLALGVSAVQEFPVPFVEIRKAHAQCVLGVVHSLTRSNSLHRTLGDRLQEITVKNEPLLPLVPAQHFERLEMGDAKREGLEIRADFEPFRLVPEHDVGLLQDIIGTCPRSETADVAMNRRLMGRHQFQILDVTRFHGLRSGIDPQADESCRVA